MIYYNYKPFRVRIHIIMDYNQKNIKDQISILNVKYDVRYLYCIIDGKLLSFLSESDVYSLFGNILDNAIEANRKLPKEERMIGLSVKKIQNFVVIQEYNGFSGTLVNENGLIKSTKKDKTWHGYGLKSIQYIVDKYNGDLKIDAKNQTFNIKIVFYNIE